MIYMIYHSSQTENDLVLVLDMSQFTYWPNEIVSMSERRPSHQMNLLQVIKKDLKKLRVYASQNGQKKGRSLKITKHILSRFLFHKKLI